MTNDKFPLNEDAYRPDNYNEVCNNEKFHFSDKGCDIEMRLEKNEDCYGLYKYCKTHKVLCSKTGWELGWYQGTKSVIDVYCINCNKKIQHGNFCKHCRSDINGFRGYIEYQTRLLRDGKETNTFSNLKNITIESMEYLKDLYTEKLLEHKNNNNYNRYYYIKKYKTYLKLVDMNIKEKKSCGKLTLDKEL